MNCGRERLRTCGRMEENGMTALHYDRPHVHRTMTAFADSEARGLFYHHHLPGSEASSISSHSRDLKNGTFAADSLRHVLSQTKQPTSVIHTGEFCTSSASTSSTQQSYRSPGTSFTGISSPAGRRTVGTTQASSSSSATTRPIIRRANPTSDFSRMPTILTRLKRNLSTGLGLPLSYDVPTQPSNWDKRKHFASLESAWLASQCLSGLFWVAKLYEKTIDKMLRQFPELTEGEHELRPEWVEYVLWRAHVEDLAASPVYRYV